jgi:cysteine protease ATG4
VQCFHITETVLTATQLARNHKPIFSIQDEPPVWPSDGDSIGLESFSDPDEVPAGDDDDDDDGDGELEDDEAGGDDELFEAARSRSPSTSPDPEPAPKRRLRVPVLVPTLSGGSGVSADTEFFDVEDDPRTPGPGSTFARGAGKIPAPTHEIEIEHDPIEDDWVDPSLPTPIHSPEASPSLQPATAELPGSSTTSLVSAKTSRSGASGGSGGRSGARRGSGSRRRAPEPAYPFPVAPDPDGPEDEDEDALARTLQPEKRLPQMRTATARDGGRTKSGGVRGVPLEDT